MKRLEIIDGFRGFFLLFMGIVHFNDITDSILGKLNHHRFGWVQDAQGFVFISGLVVGLVYGKKFLRQPTVSSIFQPILKRIGTIYQHQAALIFILLAAALLLGAYAPSNLGPYQREPFAFTGLSLLLVTASTHMGILPMYIFFLLVTPFAFQALHKGYVVPFFLVVLLSWLFAQTGLLDLASGHLQQGLALWGVRISFGIGFDAFAWQVFFFVGFYFGFRMAEGKMDLGYLKQPQYRAAFLISLVAIFLLGVFFRTVNWNMLGLDYSTFFEGRTDRGSLTFIFPIAYALDLFAVVWMLVVGVDDRNRLIRAASKAMAWLFSRRLFVVLGQHSLHVFSFHILMFYFLATVVPLFHLSHLGRSIVLIVAVATLWIAAYGHAWLQARDAARAKQVSLAKG